MQVAVLIAIDRIDLQSDIAEIFLCQLTCLTDVFHIALCAALAGQHQDFLDTGIRDNFHLMLNFLEVQLLSMNVIVTVESTVNAVILTVVCNIKRRKQINRIAEMLARLDLRTLRHPLQKRQRRRRQQCFKIFHRASLMLQSRLYLFGGVFPVIVGVHLLEHLVHNIGINLLHTLHIFHVIGAARRISLQFMLMFQGRLT